MKRLVEQFDEPSKQELTQTSVGPGKKSVVKMSEANSNGLTADHRSSAKLEAKYSNGPDTVEPEIVRLISKVHATFPLPLKIGRTEEPDKATDDMMHRHCDAFAAEITCSAPMLRERFDFSRGGPGWYQHLLASVGFLDYLGSASFAATRCTQATSIALAPADDPALSLAIANAPYARDANGTLTICLGGAV